MKALLFIILATSLVLVGCSSSSGNKSKGFRIIGGDEALRSRCYKAINDIEKKTGLENKLKAVRLRVVDGEQCRPSKRFGGCIWSIRHSNVKGKWLSGATAGKDYGTSADVQLMKKTKSGTGSIRTIQI